MAIYTTAFEPVADVWLSRHIKGWQVTCHREDGVSYPIALCTNRVAAEMIAEAMNGPPCRSEDVQDAG